MTYRWRSAPVSSLTLLGRPICGKTTTLRMIAGFQEPSAGRVFIGDRDVTRIEANDPESASFSRTAHCFRT
jgi:iron(III) transport system ATP-binding protein